MFENSLIENLLKTMAPLLDKYSEPVKVKYLKEFDAILNGRCDDKMNLYELVECQPSCAYKTNLLNVKTKLYSNHRDFVARHDWLGQIQLILKKNYDLVQSLDLSNYIMVVLFGDYDSIEAFNKSLHHRINLLSNQNLNEIMGSVFNKECINPNPNDFSPSSLNNENISVNALSQSCEILFKPVSSLNIPSPPPYRNEVLLDLNDGDISKMLTLIPPESDCFFRLPVNCRNRSDPAYHLLYRKQPEGDGEKDYWEENASVEAGTRFHLFL